MISPQIVSEQRAIFGIWCRPLKTLARSHVSLQVPGLRCGGRNIRPAANTGYLYELSPGIRFPKYRNINARRVLRDVGVEGSNPFTPTIHFRSWLRDAAD